MSIDFDQSWTHPWNVHFILEYLPSAHSGNTFRYEVYVIPQARLKTPAQSVRACGKPSSAELKQSTYLK